MVATMLEALHTMAEGQEAIDFNQSNCKKPGVFDLLTLPTMAKVQRPSQFKLVTF
jgi:hypothetical protein